MKTISNLHMQVVGERTVFPDVLDAQRKGCIWEGEVEDARRRWGPVVADGEARQVHALLGGPPPVGSNGHGG